MEKKYTCCICGKKGNDYGNNSKPYKDEGRCCNECNLEYVIPARLKAFEEQNKELVMNNDKLRLIIIQAIIETKTKADLLKALDYGLCFVNQNWEDEE